MARKLMFLISTQGKTKEEVKAEAIKAFFGGASVGQEERKFWVTERAKSFEEKQVEKILKKTAEQVAKGEYFFFKKEKKK